MERFDPENPRHVALARDAWESVRNGLGDGLAGVMEIMGDEGVAVPSSSCADLAEVLAR